MAFDLSELQNIDYENVGSWPPVIKGLAIIILCAAVLGLGYWFDTKAQLEELDKARTKENSLKKTFETKQRKAVNLDAYKMQMKEMEESFGTMLRQLPSKTEVADLLIDITQTGLASGLEFNLFKPQSESPQEFYSELPITLKVNGSYHQFGDFVSAVAALPRIVTLHNISIAGTESNLTMDATAKTYRYLDEEEISQNAAKKKKKKKKKRRR